LRVNPALDPSQGGTLDRLRDGGINGVDYRYNTTAAASFSDRLDGLIAEIGNARAFDSGAGLQSGVSVLDFGTASVAWLEDLRQATATGVAYQSTLLAHTTDALSNASGVNIDEEYAKQLQLEQSYAASSKLIGIIDQLFKTLLEAVG
jgi:flagellar hook-associated protein 1 FlgK